ncbi:hypothetical protein AB0D97_25880 [Streptomyces roseus]|uniref:hypothetical protein n=1 Tax=Streptomyces TaxID=1883 RepID=UPI00340EA44A
MSRKVVLTPGRDGQIHPEARLSQACVQSVLDQWESGTITDRAGVQGALLMALDGNGADFGMLAEVITQGKNDIPMDGSTGYARLA